MNKLFSSCITKDGLNLFSYKREIGSKIGFWIHDAMKQNRDFDFFQDNEDEGRIFFFYPKPDENRHNLNPDKSSSCSGYSDKSVVLTYAPCNF